MSARQSWWLRFKKSPAHTQTNIVCTAIIAFATVIYTCVAFFQFMVMRSTLSEMRLSGEQSTRQMWSAVDNVNWLARSADLSQKVTEKQASDIVAEMQRQTGAQIAAATATGTGANAAESATRIAQQTLWVSQGANVITDKPTFDFASHRATIPFSNVGHMVSGPAEITIHEATFAISADGTSRPIEAHRMIGPVESIPMSPTFQGVIDIPSATSNGVTTGAQGINIAGFITYDIGIPGAPKRTWKFCYFTNFLKQTNSNETRACLPGEMMEILRAIEDHPPR